MPSMTSRAHPLAHVGALLKGKYLPEISRPSFQWTLFSHIALYIGDPHAIWTLFADPFLAPTPPNHHCNPLGMCTSVPRLGVPHCYS